MKRPTFEVLGDVGGPYDSGVASGCAIACSLLTNSGWRFEGVGEHGADLTIALPSSDDTAPVNKVLVISSSKVYASRQIDGSLRPLVPMDEKEMVVVDHLGDSARLRQQLRYINLEANWLSGGTPPSDVMLLRMFPVAEDSSRALYLATDGKVEGSGRQVMTLLDKGDCEAYMKRLIKRLMDGAFGVYNVGSRQTFTQMEKAKLTSKGAPITNAYPKHPTILPWEVPDMVRTRALTGLTFQEKSLRAILKAYNVT